MGTFAFREELLNERGEVFFGFYTFFEVFERVFGFGSFDDDLEDSATIVIVEVFFNVDTLDRRDRKGVTSSFVNKPGVHEVSPC